MSSPSVIRDYHLVAGLGKGGMARVYLAMTKKQGGFTKLLVLKVLRGELDGDLEFLQMFLQEAKIAARLNHPHVVQTNEVGEDAGRYFIAMEYLEGQSLSGILTRAGRTGMPLGEHLRILCDALEGLHYAHELTDYDGTPLRIVHRDVSPQNVFVTYTGQAKILDFGIAKVSGSTRTQKGVLKGKIGYMAPEQAVGVPLDRRADVFAAGVMLWEALAGRRLVTRSEDEVTALTRRVTGKDPKIRDVKPDVPEALAAICDRAMAHEVEQRYPTAAAMQEDIEAYLRSVGPVDHRRVAVLMEQHFAEDRSRVRKLVEEQVKRADEPGPMIDIHTESTVTPPSLESVEIPVELAAPTVTVNRPKRGRRLALTGVAALVAIGGVVALLVARRAPDAAKAEALPPAASSLAAAAAAAATAGTAANQGAPAPKMIEITLKLSPPGAKATLDGAPVAGTTATLLFDENARHELAVTAVGHLPDKRTVVANRDQVVDVALARATPAAGPQPPAQPAQPAQRATDFELKKGPRKPPRTVDTSDPYN